MNFNYSKENKELTIKFIEEIDQHTVDRIRRKIDNEIEMYIPKQTVFDFGKINFMDSSGIGMVVGRYKLIKMLGGNMQIINVNKTTKRIFDMSGVSRIIDIKETEDNNNEKSL